MTNPVNRRARPSEDGSAGETSSVSATSNSKVPLESKGSSSMQPSTSSKRKPDGGDREWHPAPWRYVPDFVWGMCGVLILLPIAPGMAVLITAAELAMWALKKFHAAFPIVGNTCKNVIMAVAETVAPYVLRDKRDAPYLPWVFFLAMWGPLLMSISIYRTINYGFEVWWFVVYHFLRIGPRFRFFAHAHVLFHKEGHDHSGFFRPPFNIFNRVCEWWISFFYGLVPNSYNTAHNKIHHKFDNGPSDVHTNLDLDRSKTWSFFVYMPRFFAYWTGISPVIHFLSRGELKFARRVAEGMLVYYSVIAGASYWNFAFAFSYLIFPHLEDVVFFGGISYMWHCYVEPGDPLNQYVNSVTILDGHDNIWNEDFHVVHHDSPTTHWTEVVKHYENHKDEYVRCRATVFRDCEEGQMLYWMLAQKWDELAAHFVDVRGELDHEGKKELILRRLRYKVTYRDLNLEWE